MKKLIKILLFILLIIAAPAVVMIAVFDWHPFLVGGILFFSLITFSPMKRKPKRIAKFDLENNWIIAKGWF